jgi:anti-sigma28 factor (negative regulator of flagellin synthesis)
MPVDPSGDVTPISVDPETPTKPEHAETAPSVESAITTRIERIRSLIATGEYKVDLDELAVRVVEQGVLRTEKPS